jgi:hypothetical protein
MTDGQQSARWRLFGLLCVVAVAVIAVALYLQRQRMRPAETEVVESAPVPAANQPADTPGPDMIEAPRLPETGAQHAPTDDSPRRVFYRYTGLDQYYGRLAFQDGPAGSRQYAGNLSCDVAYVAGGRGICLVAKRGVITTYLARLFDATTFAQTAELPLAGVPSRARVSLQGNLAAYTVFLTGHGYTQLDFSTQTVILDVASAKPLLDLEKDFTVLRDGVQIKEQDFNFWGVIFAADARSFYATLSTGGKHLLVRGDIAARTMTVLHENVECPSLSPDGTRVAYKKRFTENGRIFWQLQVLDIASGRETALAERRSIDDQLEWLDNARVLYSVPLEDGDAGGGTDVWVAGADGRQAPSLFLRQAYSPSVSRAP